MSVCVWGCSCLCVHVYTYACVLCVLHGGWTDTRRLPLSGIPNCRKRWRNLQTKTKMSAASTRPASSWTLWRDMLAFAREPIQRTLVEQMRKFDLVLRWDTIRAKKWQKQKVLLSCNFRTCKAMGLPEQVCVDLNSRYVEEVSGNRDSKWLSGALNGRRSN